MASIDEEINSKFNNERHRFVTNLVFTAGWVKSIAANNLKPFGISLPQYNILRILRGAGDWMAMNDVKNLMIEKSPNATRLADKLLAKKLIERRRSAEDRRVVYVKITPAGAKMIETSDDQDSEIMVALNERMTEDEAKLVSAILDRFRG